VLAEPFSPDNAVQAGFLDRVVGATDLPDAARSAAEAAAALDLNAHLAAKLRARQPALSALRAAIDADNAEFQARA
jgi:enoyl-CoA hydratase